MPQSSCLRHALASFGTRERGLATLTIPTYLPAYAVHHAQSDAPANWWEDWIDIGGEG